MQYDREKPWAEWIRGAVLFADVSGFTSMSEALSVLGAEGAEILTDILNRYFTEMIGILNAHGGQVMKFGGDAILCFFPDAGCPMPDVGSPAMAAAAAGRMMQSITRLQNIRTPVKKFALQMKVGIAQGEVLLAGVGDPEVRCDYVFAGKPVDLSADAEHHAKAGEIIVWCDRLGNCPKGDCVEKGFCRMPHDCGLRIADRGTTKLTTRISQDADPSPYLIQEVCEMVKAGYHRYVGALQPVVPVFLQFSGFSYNAVTFDLQRLHEFFSLAMRITHQYGGRLNRISMGDKGSTMLILFGAPRQIEKKEELACRWALDLREQAKTAFPELGFKFGMTSGRVFSGIVGGSNRYEYTVMGDVVNLAARLMQGATRKQICVDQELFEKTNGNFAFADLGPRQVKGKAKSVQVYALKEKKEMRFAASKEDFIGRTAEIREILEHLEAAKAGNSGMVLIEGVAGVGKSFLAGQILSQASKNGWSLLMGKGGTGSRNYAPWIYVMTALLFGAKKPSPADLRNVLRETEESFVEFLPWHLEYFGLQVVDCGISESDVRKLKSQYDEDTKKNLFHHQICVILLKRVGKSPTLLHMDDLHWFDSLSKDLLLALLNHLKDQPLLVLTTTRPEWNKEEFINRSLCHTIALQPLEASDAREMAERFLGGPVKDPLVDFLHQHTKGNPFFTRQLLEYLKQNDLVFARLGEWSITRGAAIKKALSGEDVIVTQAERLTFPEKVHLRTAACVGPSFALEVLKSVLASKFSITAFQSLCSQGYFLEAGDNQYAFPHDLVRETIYRSIPQRLRKDKHKRIGMAMEKLFDGSVDQHHATLANHFVLGGLRGKAISYSISAGEGFYRSAAFPEAVAHFSHAHRFLERSRDPRKWDVSLALCRCFSKIGQLKEGLVFARKLCARAKLERLEHIFFETSAIKFDLMFRSAKYGYVRDAEHILRQSGVDTATRVHLLNLLGRGYYALGFLDRAEVSLKAALGEAEQSDQVSPASSYVWLSSVFKMKRDFAEAHRILDEVKSSDERLDDYQRILVNTESANLMKEEQHPEEAAKLYLSTIPIAERIGNYFLMGVLFANLAMAEISLSRWQSAEKYLDEASLIFSNHGALKELAESLVYRGMASFYQQKWIFAYECYLNAARIFEKIKEVQQACWNCYNLAEVLLELVRIEEARQWLSRGRKMLASCKDEQLSALYRELDARVLMSSKRATTPNQ